MASDQLDRLLAGNAAHVASLSEDYFATVQDGQAPSVVSVCCSDSRVSQEGMFDVDEPGALFTSGNIGNQAWATVDDEKVVDGSLLYPLAHTGTKTAAVVGHTGCGAVTATYYQVTDEEGDEPAGIQHLVDQLKPVVRDGLDRGIGTTGDESRNVDELVEYNVDRQVAFLNDADEVPDDVTVYGLVYDFHGTYDVPLGTTVLVNADGERSPTVLRERAGEEYADRVGRLTEY
ncbi:carbonic anhydrase [Halobacteriales archaeon Cl-PHB]